MCGYVEIDSDFLKSHGDKPFSITHFVYPLIGMQWQYEGKAAPSDDVFMIEIHVIADPDKSEYEVVKSGMSINEIVEAGYIVIDPIINEQY